MSTDTGSSASLLHLEVHDVNEVRNLHVFHVGYNVSGIGNLNPMRQTVTQVPMAGFEPAACGFEDRRSNPLSYTGVERKMGLEPITC